MDSQGRDGAVEQLAAEQCRFGWTGRSVAAYSAFPSRSVTAATGGGGARRALAACASKPFARSGVTQWFARQSSTIVVTSIASKWATVKVERTSQRGNGDRTQDRERTAERGDFNDAPPF